MTCSETLEFISAYLDEELAPPLQDQVAAHIVECRVCQAYRDDLLRIHELLGSGRVCGLPEGLWERIEGAAVGVTARRTLSLREGLVRAASIAAGFVLYLGAYGGLLLWQETSRERQVAEPSPIKELLADAAAPLAGQTLAERRLVWLDQRPENRVLEALLEER